MKHSDIPNLITVLRILLVVPVIWLLLTQEYIWALFLFGVAGLSDGLDGFLAKRYGWVSHLGSLLDPIADKFLLISCYLVLGAQRLIPLWLVGLVIIRDMVIVTGATIYHFRIQQLVEGVPSLISKLNTLMQILLVIAIILHHGALALPAAALDGLVWMVGITTLWSGANYVWIWGRRAAQTATKNSTQGQDGP